jgi:hypothetical protein
MTTENKWQKIETAPKDGTRILCYDGHNIEIAHWSSSVWVSREQSDGTWGSWLVFNSRSDSESIDATHWMYLPRPHKTIPIKTSFSGLDHDNWKLHSIDFKPFVYQDEFAENINKIAIILESLPKCDKELLETLSKAKDFACSTIIPDGTGFSRVFFNTPNDLKNFIENYKETKKEGE